jgi:hypothetical protein
MAEETPSDAPRVLVTVSGGVADVHTQGSVHIGVLLISVQEVTVRACPDREDWRGVYFDGARKCLSRLEFLLVL